MGWPRVVTGAAARILSMVMDIARTSVQQSGRANGYQEQSSNKEGRAMNKRRLWRTQACLDGAGSPFSIMRRAALPPATWAVLEGSNAPCVTRCGATDH